MLAPSSSVPPKRLRRLRLAKWLRNRLYWRGYRLSSSSGMPTAAQQQLPPGETLELVLADMPAADRLPFLACVEQRAKLEGDLEILREAKAYRQKHSL